MEELYLTYKDLAEFYLIYIREAHAADGKRPVPFATEQGIKEHTTYGERCAVANKLIGEKKLTIPCLIDDMNNTASSAYSGHPDRVFLVRKDGKLGISGQRGPRGFAPGLKDSQRWLAQYKESGTEPSLEEFVPTPASDSSPRHGEGRPNRRGRRESGSPGDGAD